MSVVHAQICMVYPPRTKSTHHLSPRYKLFNLQLHQQSYGGPLYLDSMNPKYFFKTTIPMYEDLLIYSKIKFQINCLWNRYGKMCGSPITQNKEHVQFVFRKKYLI